MNDGISAGDTAWLLTSIGLVLLMTPGVAFFYGGLVRGKNVLNTMMMSLFSMGLVALLWALVGYSLAFGEGNDWIGSLAHVGLMNVDNEAYPDTAIPSLVFVLFQMTFAIITPALISGAVVERMRFGAYALFIGAWSLLVYSPLCHWVWGGGWIARLGALDFAGGTVVHVSAGVSAVVAALILGERKAGQGAPRPHNVPFVILGGSLLWFGWFGFNGGSALGANKIAGLALVTTNLAAASGMVTWVLLEWRREGRPSAVGAMIGAVVGLVTITPAAGFVSTSGAMMMGVIGALAAYWTIALLGRLRIDDSLDVFACHGVGGLVGSVLTGVFATKSANDSGADGLLYGGGWSLLGVQVVSVLAAALFAGLMTVLVLKSLKLIMVIRVEEKEEIVGMDLKTHGETAYEYSMFDPQHTEDAQRREKSA